MTRRPPSGRGVSPFGLPYVRGALIGTCARAAPLPDDLLRRGDLDDPAVPDVGDDDVTVRQRVSVIGRVQPAGTRSRMVVPAVLPDDPPCRDVDADDHLMALFVCRDRLAVRRQECVIGREALAGRQAMRSGEPPVDGPSCIDHQDPAVPTVGDHQVPGERPRRDRRGRAGVRSALESSGSAAGHCWASPWWAPSMGSSRARRPMGHRIGRRHAAPSEAALGLCVSDYARDQHDPPTDSRNDGREHDRTPLGRAERRGQRRR